jgi:allantoin racemase
MTRILLINPNTSKEVTNLLMRTAPRFARADTQFVAMTAAFGPRYIASRLGVAVASHAAADTLAEYLRAATMRADATILGCFGDPGLVALREIAPMPVVGMAEASVLAATQLGPRFAILTGGAPWIPMLEELVAAIGMTARLAAVRAVPQTGAQIAADPDGSLAGLATAAARCVGEDGADVVILGGAALAGLAERLQDRVKVPLIDSLAASVAMAEALARTAPAIPPPRAAIAPVDSVGLSDALGELFRTPRQ